MQSIVIIGNQELPAAVLQALVANVEGTEPNEYEIFLINHSNHSITNRIRGGDLTCPVTKVKTSTQTTKFCST